MFHHYRFLRYPRKCATAGTGVHTPVEMSTCNKPVCNRLTAYKNILGLISKLQTNEISYRQKYRYHVSVLKERVSVRGPYKSPRPPPKKKKMKTTTLTIDMPVLSHIYFLE